MSLGIPAHARASALRFLRNFPRATAQRGENYFARGAVRNVKRYPEGLGFSAEVTGTQVYNTAIDYHKTKGLWQGDCDCPVGEMCKHCYALMKTVLARAASDERVHATRDCEERTQPLTDELSNALGRKLKPDEISFLWRLDAAFAQAQTNGDLYIKDLTALGWRLPGFHWDRVEPWPSFPANEREFWLYLVLFLEEHGLKVPEFMRPISDPGPLRGRVTEWRRGREVERWRKLLSRLRDDVETTAPVGELDLRLRFHSREAVIEARRGGTANFEPIKAAAFRELPKLPPDSLAPEATLLARYLRERANYGYSPALPYREHGVVELLGDLLRVPWLESRLVGESGAAFARPTDPLRWRLDSAADEAGNYHLRLIQPDGKVAGPFLLVVEGRPTLYLTRDTLWIGPIIDAHALTPGEETMIPAAALETTDGVHFLRKHGVELPSRLRERIRTVQMKPLLRCELQPTYPGSREETCVIHALGGSDDGSLQLIFTREGWQEHQVESTSPESLVFHDRAPLAAVPPLIELLRMRWDPYARHWHFKVTRKFAETFTNWLRRVPPEVTVELRGELASFQTDAISGTVRLSIEESDRDWFDLRVVLDVSETELTKQELKLLLDARGKWVRLGAKGWRRLEFQLSEDEDEQLSRLGLNPHDLSSEPQKLHALQLADPAAKRFLPEEQYVSVQRRASELQTRVTPEIPAAIKGELRPYQRDGFHFLAYLSTNRFGGVLADDMGLGKTLQTLTWLAWLRETEKQTAENKKQKSAASLVVCPKSVADNWRAEVERFLPALRVRVWHRLDLARLPEEIESADLHVINYAQLRSIGEALTEQTFLAVILDEGQFIKNPDSITAKLARALGSEHRIILSGTPIENRLLDLWSLMAFAMPGVLGQRAAFARNFDAKEDPFARRRLAARVRPFVLRRTKNQVAKELPDRIEEDLYCELEGEQKTLYRAELKRAQQMLLRVQTQKQLAKERFHFLTSLLRLRQICCHPRLVKSDSHAESAKAEALLEQLEPLMEEGQKVLVFSQFVEMLGILGESLKERGWPLFYLAGDTENRGELVASFQSAKGAAIFLVSLKAGGFGLNLTAASYVVLFDPWWNPAVENQAIDRTHRIGQVNKVIAYRLLIKDSIEEKIRALQKQKRGLAEDVLGEEKFAQSLTLDDLHFLFAE
jgi:SNF2-related domain/Helicase conserved C-terminal domain